MHLKAIVEGISVSHHHHHHSGWQKKLAGDVQRYMDNGDGLSDEEYICGRPRGRSTSFHYMKYKLFLSQLFVLCTHDELS